MEKILSANWGARCPKSHVAFLILHYTECDFETALKYLTAQKSRNPVSAHYLIDEDGRSIQLVEESNRAWHAGVSRWGAYENLNTWSIGIELVNPGHGEAYRPFSDAQMQALIPLCQSIIKRYNIPAAHVLGHADIAPRRKKDPGELLDWSRLAKAGIGLQPKRSDAHIPFCSIKARTLLQQIGYDIVEGKEATASFDAALFAFCRRCVPEKVATPQCEAVMDALLAYIDLLHTAENR